MHCQIWEASERFSIRLCLCRLVVPALFLFTLFVSSAWAKAPLKVEWQEGRLSVTAERTPLSQILQEVARQTGLEVQGLEGLQEKVSVRFAGLPLGEGLQKLLAYVNYVILEKRSSHGDTRPTLALVFGRWATPILSLEEALVVEEDQGKRLTALYTSAQQGDEEALQKAFFDPNQVIQATAFELLAERNRQGATTLLTEAMKSEQSEMRRQALHLLHQASQAEAGTVLPVLGEALADEDVTVKGYAIQALAEREGGEAMESLRQVLRDPDPSVRLILIESVAQKEQGQELLREALADDDEAVRSMAAFWLEQASSEGR